MTYEQAAELEPGDEIRYLDAAGDEHVATVSDPVHPFPFSRGHVVYVPIRDAMIVHTRIVEKLARA